MNVHHKLFRYARPPGQPGPTYSQGAFHQEIYSRLKSGESHAPLRDEVVGVRADPHPA